MKKILNQLSKWIINLFNFSRPEFLNLEYVDYVINNKAYFLLTWDTKNAFTLRIKCASYISHTHTASAYVALPSGMSHVKIKLSNVWRSIHQIIVLKGIDIDQQTDFEIKTNFNQINKGKINIGHPKLMLSPLQLNPLKARTININQLKEIINITHP